jgi:hypothetical protein
LENKQVGRQIYGDNAVLRKCQGDKKFPYVVALARAVNALNAAHSLMVLAGDKDTPAAQRDKMNAYFFTSAILYEALKLIRSMNAAFGKDKSFQGSLQGLLKDKTAQELERMHFKAARRDAVFHYVPNRFAEAIKATGMTDCVFLASQGGKLGDLHYEFADYIAAEMEVGGRLDNHALVTSMMQKKFEFVTQFIAHSENFLAAQLHDWGFRIRPSLGAPG